MPDLLINLVGLHDGHRPEDAIDLCLQRLERRANGPAHVDRMTMIRKELREMRAAWDKYRGESDES